MKSRTEHAHDRRGERLWQKDRMEALGRLAGGIAHDFNNLLTVINGYSDLLMTGREGALEKEDLEQIRKAGERAADLTSQLLAFSRQQVLEPRVVDLNSIVQEMDRMLRRVIGEDVELVTLFGEDLGFVEADPTQLEQVLLNLTINARHAMPQGGRLKLETRNVELDESFASSHEGARPGRYVLLEVSDTGTGMDEETVAHIFEPFVTSRGDEGGVGLGLSTVYGVVTQSSGLIDVETALGRGTTFRLYFPRCKKVSALEEDRENVSPVAHGDETILLVEDEPSVRMYATRVLRRQGYDVLQAAHGEEALSVYGEHRERIKLLLADVVMPRMGGKELAKRLRERDETLKVLFTSGYVGSDFDDLGAICGTTTPRFLKKPFRPETIAQRVRETLDA